MQLDALEYMQARIDQVAEQQEVRRQRRQGIVDKALDSKTPVLGGPSSPLLLASFSHVDLQGIRNRAVRARRALQPWRGVRDCW